MDIINMVRFVGRAPQSTRQSPPSQVSKGTGVGVFVEQSANFGACFAPVVAEIARASGIEHYEPVDLTRDDTGARRLSILLYFVYISSPRYAHSIKRANFERAMARADRVVLYCLNWGAVSEDIQAPDASDFPWLRIALLAQGVYEMDADKRCNLIINDPKTKDSIRNLHALLKNFT